MANLEEMLETVNTLAQTVTDLKKAVPVDKDAIGKTVKELLDAKRSYAENNNGIGVDGKPWEEPMSKSEKKKKEKAEKAAKAAVTVNGKQVSYCTDISISGYIVLLCALATLTRECDDIHKV
jgi:hypothetical protein